jgi:hypothetical protein
MANPFHYLPAATLALVLALHVGMVGAEPAIYTNESDVGVAGVAPSRPPPNQEPAPAAPSVTVAPSRAPETWYGWQILPVDCVAIGLVVGGVTRQRHTTARR